MESLQNITGFTRAGFTLLPAEIHCLQGTQVIVLLQVPLSHWRRLSLDHPAKLSPTHCCCSGLVSCPTLGFFISILTEFIDLEALTSSLSSKSNLYAILISQPLHLLLYFSIYSELKQGRKIFCIKPLPGPSPTPHQDLQASRQVGRRQLGKRNIRNKPL